MLEALENRCPGRDLEGGEENPIYGSHTAATVSHDVEGTCERLGGEEEEEWERFGCTVQLHPASPVSPLVRDTGTSPAQAPRGPWH